MRSMELCLSSSLLWLKFLRHHHAQGNKGYYPSFSFKFSCFPWAKQCFFISTKSIHDHLTEIPLSPLVALGAYFTSQKTSILDHSQGHDPTIQMLYNLSQKIFENIAVNENTTVDDLLSLCQKSELKLKKVLRLLRSQLKPAQVNVLWIV